MEKSRRAMGRRTSSSEVINDILHTPWVRVTSAVVAIASICWLAATTFAGRGSAADSAFEAAVSTQYAVDIVGVPLDAVALRFKQVNGSEWRVELTAQVPYRTGPSRVLTCRYALPRGSTPVEPFPGGPQPRRVADAAAAGVEIWEHDCTQKSHPSPGAMGVALAWTVPDSVLVRQSGSRWSLQFTLLPNAAALINRQVGEAKMPSIAYEMGQANHFGKVEATYEVVADDWEVEGTFLPPTDVQSAVTATTVAARRPDASRQVTTTPTPTTSKTTTSLPDSAPAVVSFHDATSEQRRAALTGGLLFFLPLFAQVALGALHLPEPADNPQRRPAPPRRRRR